MVSRPSLPLTLLLGFAAGFIATLVFHQAALALVGASGLAPTRPWNTAPTGPFAVPTFVNAAFWGGVWGIVWALVVRHRPSGLPLAAAGLLFGAVAPTLVAWFVVAPLKGLPLAAGFVPLRMTIGPLVNGAWGLGTALLFAAFSRWGSRSYN